MRVSCSHGLRVVVAAICKVAVRPNRIGWRTRSIRSEYGILYFERTGLPLKPMSPAPFNHPFMRLTHCDPFLGSLSLGRSSRQPYGRMTDRILAPLVSESKLLTPQAPPDGFQPVLLSARLRRKDARGRPAVASLSVRLIATQSQAEASHVGPNIPT